MVLGTFLPVGEGSFKPAGYGTFGYLIVSKSFGEGDKFLLHSNFGGNFLHIDGSNNLIATWGFGTQIKAYKGMHFVGEVFSGDPYIPGTGISYQVGYHYFFSDLLQIDMTVGKVIAGENIIPLWFSAGVRIVTKKFLKKKNGSR